MQKIIKNHKSINSLFILFLTCMPFTLCASMPEMTLVEKYEYWDHPTRHVFNDYGIKLYRVTYGKNENCLSFYVDFKFDPLTSTDDYFNKLYLDTFVANNYRPYSFVSEKDNIRINVGWKDQSKNILDIHVHEASSIAKCEGIVQEH